MNLRITILLVITILFFSCRHSQEKNTKTVSKDSNLKITEQENTQTKKAKHIEKEIDSMSLQRILKEALNISQQNIKLDNFHKEYDQTVDSIYNLTTYITIGNLFSKNKKHLLIKRERIWTTFINIYKIENDKIMLIKFAKQDNSTYINDSIFDVNGDGLKDFVMHWYPTSGCCLANNHVVSLFIENDGTLTREFKFINPTFYPKENTIRGFGYAPPNEVNLYKYKWNGFKIDTIEFINHNSNKKGEFIKTKHKLHYATEKDGIVLKNIPKEYHTIKDFDWVTGDLMKIYNEE